jgi:hypothetical protein
VRNCSSSGIEAKISAAAKRSDFEGIT